MTPNDPPTQTPTGVRRAADLALLGSVCVGVAVLLTTLYESPSVRTIVSALTICGVWLVLGIRLRVGLRGRSSLAYWLYMVAVLPLVLGGGAFAVLAGVKWALPVSEVWPIGLPLFCGVALHSLAGFVLARPRNRPVVGPEDAYMGKRVT